MNWFEALIAGVIQGLTEFLPVSSSGHLVIYGTLTSETESGNLAFTVFLHLATLLAVIIVFRKDVWMLIRELGLAIGDIFRGRRGAPSPKRRFLLMVIIGTIPAVIIGGGIKVFDIDAMLENIFVVAVMLVVTAVLMFSVDRIREGGRRNAAPFTAADAPLKTAWLVGILQGIAILPGLSRSGSTIFGGVLGGLKKEFAVKYAFILSIPVILGSAVIELRSALKAEDSGEIGTLGLALGFIAAFFCGLLAIKLIKVLIKSNKFYIFGIYCLCASAFAFLVGFGVIHG